MVTKMELLCPHCLIRLTVSDDKSGQVLNCPMCNGVFAAPSLAPAPSRSPAPSPPPVNLPPPVSAPPPPPGDYTRKFAFRLRPDILVYVPPVCLLLIFVLSFGSWHNVRAATGSD